MKEIPEITMSAFVPEKNSPLFNEFCQALESFDRRRAEEIFQQALTQGSPQEIVEQLIAPVLEKIGSDWDSGRVALSQVYMSGRLCEDLVSKMLQTEGIAFPEDQPRQAIVVLHDYHMLGKRIVYSILRTSGFNLIDYGRMDVDELIERVMNDRITVLLISTLMLPSALKVQQVRTGLQARGAQVRILVGGAPFLFDPNLWQEVGADAMGRNAGDGMRILRQWQEESL
ncbi:Cobalamin-binding protein [Gammaproteobacteria bacterium]